MVKLYHYTSRENLNPILSSYKIEGNKPGGRPWGVYLTELNPGRGTHAIIANNFGTDGSEVSDEQYQALVAKTQVAFEFEHEKLRGVYRDYDIGAYKSKNRNVWIYRHGLSLGLCNQVKYDNVWHPIPKSGNR